LLILTQEGLAMFEFHDTAKSRRDAAAAASFDWQQRAQSGMRPVNLISLISG
jgi:hypothetical protein